jgi:intracellular sulfur oxidation DsrE/DsrF family protein
MYKLQIDVACINRCAVIMKALKSHYETLITITINVVSPGAGSELIVTSNNRDRLEAILLELYGTLDDACVYITAC